MWVLWHKIEYILFSFLPQKPDCLVAAVLTFFEASDERCAYSDGWRPGLRLPEDEWIPASLFNKHLGAHKTHRLTVVDFKSTTLSGCSLDKLVA
ncbi:hypothetical protein EYF80_034509 [Liparis tanakae]|uniref:Uncharacterized protein n=1 Tax=Liparis tanakae TaxID=230148 RepID=A0A4Z2GR49_9TELE|nr:hypothetical protein EYF80_034509 [Liparis tanakae]